MFIGRKVELKQLEQYYVSNKAHLLVLYGRRRIGKSSLIDEFANKKSYLKFEGVEGAHTNIQIKTFMEDFLKQNNDPFLTPDFFKNWNLVFDFLDQYLLKQKKRTIIIFDEFQWLAAGQKKLVALFKKYWDNNFKKRNVIFILCGSISSYMIKHVIKSSALYGRIDWNYNLQGISPLESFFLLKKKRSQHEILQYLLIFGAIPKYLELIETNRSLEQNINRLAFCKGGFLVNEFGKIFYSQFKETNTYEKIVRIVSESPKSLNEISNILKIKSGGSLKTYLDNLKQAGFLIPIYPFDKGKNSKRVKYSLSDEYIRFYLKYIEPNIDLIENNSTRNLFQLLVKDSWDSWLGFAFERFCIKNALKLAEVMGFIDKVTGYGPVYKPNTYQIDLIYYRSDKTITMCEIKYHENPISPAIIPEIEKKCIGLEIPKNFTLEKALISIMGPNKALLNAEYFHHIVILKDFFKDWS